MTAKKNFIQNERVALAEDIRHRGYIHAVYNGYNVGDQQTYTVQWDKNGAFLYLKEALITEAEANEIQAKIDTEKAEEQAKLIKDGLAKGVAEKFKAMEQKATNSVEKKNE